MVDDVDELGLPVWPAAERNKQPILEQLLLLLGDRSGILLEIASATGQHAVHFAPHLEAFLIQPSDYDEQHLKTLTKRVSHQKMANLLAPVRLDVTEEAWPLSHADVIYCANMIHIAPYEATVGLFQGAARLLKSPGLLVTYGPYRFSGRHTSESNAAFDEGLRERDPTFGVRDFDDLRRLAEPLGLVPREPIAMPNNNFLLAWDRVLGAAK